MCDTFVTQLVGHDMCDKLVTQLVGHDMCDTFVTQLVGYNMCDTFVTQLVEHDMMLKNEIIWKNNRWDMFMAEIEHDIEDTPYVT